MEDSEKRMDSCRADRRVDRDESGVPPKRIIVFNWNSSIFHSAENEEERYGMEMAWP
jgi:hypothetical protein